MRPPYARATTGRAADPPAVRAQGAAVDASDAAYERLERDVVSRATRCAAAGDVLGIERIRATDRALGQRRPNTIARIDARLARQLDLARARRLELDKRLFTVSK